MSRFRLSSILRARKAQEDAAKGGVLRARAEARAAAQRTEQQAVELQNRMIMPDPSDAAAFVAAMAARRAIAGELSIRRQQAEEAERRVGAKVENWSAASQRRRMVEKLAERHETARRQADAAADQRAVDDLSTTRRPQTGRGTGR
ncbi:flagellar FliJ family protein [Planomonospora sp. ID67723]|uniref:flagellar FliJ family protein n=1 Tax=Planomonospora sp. ID67723 TaxID=2738134 RepID=UPI0018C40E41|nr:flagellar FliJ family protein [Planomonospora sp. ID67723]MBG0833310.1 flagellar FliJ family protein [Planomonospora sp. ID67723]